MVPAVYQWCGFKSRRGKNKHLTALKSNSNTVWFNFQTYIFIYIYIQIIVIKMSKCGSLWFDPRSGQTKDYAIGICCFSTKHVALSRKSKDWLAWDQDIVSEWGDMSI